MKTLKVWYTMIFAFFVMSNITFGQGTWNGSAVATTTNDSVGIGTTSPADNLHIFGDNGLCTQACPVGLTIENASTENGPARITFKDDQPGKQCLYGV